MMRGDDDLFSVMDEMSNGKRQEPNKPKDMSSSSSSINLRVRMVPELQGYNQAEGKSCPENGHGINGHGHGHGNIWNPYISVDLQDPGTALYTPPTSPYVEVARRRAYEKFKKNFYSTFNWIANNHQMPKKSDANAGAGAGADADETKTKKVFDFNSIWNKSSHSVLERYYFASKVEESFQVIANRNNQNTNANANDPHTRTLRVPRNAGIAQIANFVSAGREDSLLMDPILLAPFQRNRIANNLLRNEVQFQLLREYKKATKGKDPKAEAVHEFFESNAFKNKFSKTARSINDVAIEAEGEFLADLQRKAAQVKVSSSSAKGKRKGIPKLSFESKVEKESGGILELYSLKFSGLSFRISISHYEKLQILFDRHNPSSKSIQGHVEAFYCALFTLLTRYDLLEGGGLQSAISGNVFDVLLNHFDCKTECFASPLNCRYERYFSAFEDTDAPFGSLGSFFNFDFEKLTNGGCFQANPPFASDFILQMCKQIETVLSNDSSPPFMFIVFVPSWQESQGWQALSNAASLAHHLFLSQKDNVHYYCEGTQHRRLKGRYRIASFDTSVFFLQNRAGREKWKITDEMLNQLTQAFGSNPEESELCTTVATEKDHSRANPSQKKTESQQQQAKMDMDKRNNSRKRKQKHAGKKAKPKKKFISDDGKSQLAILSSLGISTAAGESNKTTKITKSKTKKKQKK